jgi:hypothetical protein
LENKPVEIPDVWARLVRYHYVKGLHRGWRANFPLLRRD